MAELYIDAINRAINVAALVRAFEMFNNRMYSPAAETLFWRLYDCRNNPTDETEFAVLVAISRLQAFATITSNSTAAAVASATADAFEKLRTANGCKKEAIEQ